MNLFPGQDEERGGERERGKPLGLEENETLSFFHGFSLWETLTL